MERHNPFLPNRPPAKLAPKRGDGGMCAVVFLALIFAVLTNVVSGGVAWFARGAADRRENARRFSAAAGVLHAAAISQAQAQELIDDLRSSMLRADDLLPSQEPTPAPTPVGMLL